MEHHWVLTNEGRTMTIQKFFDAYRGDFRAGTSTGDRPSLVCGETEFTGGLCSLLLSGDPRTGHGPGHRV